MLMQRKTPQSISKIGPKEWECIFNLIKSKPSLCDSILQKTVLIGMFNGPLSSGTTTDDSSIPFHILQSIIHSRAKPLRRVKSNILACALMNYAISAQVLDQLLMEEDGQWLSHEEDDYLLNSSFLFQGVPWPLDKLAVLLRHFGNGAHFIFKRAHLSGQDMDVLSMIAKSMTAERYLLMRGFYCLCRILDSRDRPSLHIALQEQLGWDDGLALVLCLNTTQTSVRLDGRLPLHLALGNTNVKNTECGCAELEWNQGIKQLVFSYSPAVAEKDGLTGLYPFMLASANRHSVDVIYELLRHSPFVMIPLSRS